MKIKEVTNPEEQLGLLRVIIDNTWSAIKQQADTQARQKVAQPAPKSKAKSSKASKPAPYAAEPKQLPKPKPLYPSKPLKNPQPTATAANNFSHKPAQSSAGSQKLSMNNLPTNSMASLTNNEKDELINLSRGVLPKPL